MAKGKGRRWHAALGVVMLWIIGWLFTITWFHLSLFWEGALAFVIWPYYLWIQLFPYWK